MAPAAWLLLSPLLLWSPATGVAPWVRAEAVAVAGHLLWFLLGAALLIRARPSARLLPAWCVLTLMGLVFEVGQSWVPGRHPSWLDVVLNAVGAALGSWLFRPQEPRQRQLR